MESGKHHHDEGVIHSHAPAGHMKKAFFLTIIILSAEVIFGIISHSLALLSDAGHVITDLAAIGLTWYTLKQAEKPADEKRTYGYQRASILAAFVNGIVLIFLTFVILWEAYRRFLNPEPINSTWLFIGAGVGLIVNLYLGLGMRKEKNLNVKSAVLHILGDAAASAGVIVGGVIIALTGWTFVDPLISVGIAILIAFSAWKIVKQTISILMEGTPADVDVTGLIKTMKSVKGVRDVHHLHVWSITSGENALSCHVVLDGTISVSESQTILKELEAKIKSENIEHTTIQIEDSNHKHKNKIIGHDFPDPSAT